MQKPDEFRVTYDQNPAMQEALRDMNEGDKGKAELRFTIKAKDEEGADLIADAVIPDGYEVDESAGPTGDMGGPTSTEAVTTPLAMMVRRKKAKTAPTS